MLTKENLLKKKIALITLGCDKNRVDAEQMLYLLKQFGFEFTNDVSDAEIVIINTCAFLNASRKESLETIFEVKQNSKKLEKLIITGCLSQKNESELKQNLHEADLILPLKENKFIVRHILSLYGNEESFVPSFCNLNRVISTPSNYAYLKIADGCNNFCSYCTIPFIRGRYKSVPIEKLVLEAEDLVKSGVKEIILVAQDVTNYGHDLYGEYKLVELIKSLSKIENLKWIRLLYCYPELITDELINEIDNNPKVCKYIDIPLQHVSNRILKLMNRKGDKKKIESIMQKLRGCKNYISIRSTFIVGFPSEKRKEINEIKDFLTKYNLNNVGFFAYSKEEGTKAYYMKKQIPNFIKNNRVKKLQKVQNNVIINNNKNLVGKTLTCVCENACHTTQNGENVCLFRSEYNAPVIDTEIFAKNTSKFDIKPKSFYKIKITDVIGIDLLGEIIDEIK